MTDCEVMRIEKEAILRTLNEEPTFSERFVAHLLQRTIRDERWTNYLMCAGLVQCSCGVSVHVEPNGNRASQVSASFPSSIR